MFRQLASRLLPEALATLILGGQFAMRVWDVRAATKSAVPLFQDGNGVRHKLTGRELPPKSSAFHSALYRQLTAGMENKNTAANRKQRIEPPRVSLDQPLSGAIRQYSVESEIFREPAPITYVVSGCFHSVEDAPG